MRRRAIIGALLLITVGVALGATVFRTDIAQATGLAQAVTVDNTAANPVPVREQNLDGGNIRVHEEGTADVHVTNTSLAVTPAAPITGGGGLSGAATGSSSSVDPPATASALSITMSSEVSGVVLSFEGNFGALFEGPEGGGHSSVDLALTRPIKFDRIFCTGTPFGSCAVSWVGNQP
jgi:hypothetical protein